MSSHVMLLLLAATFADVVNARAEESPCDVRVRISSGWVCGARRWAAGDRVYASFRGVPYARQPLGELRFKELQPAEKWTHLYDATEEGDICPQTDVFYGKMMKSKGMSESCIHANIHVPIEALSDSNSRPVRDLKAPLVEAVEEVAEEADNVCTASNDTGLPILVFIHGGGFEFGSGDTDVHGPEELVAKDVIVVSFNYRLNVFGFLSLNTSKIPGNNGLRDMITLLRWVRENARAFGGNPDDVTLAGQSAGSISAHLLTLSPEAKGLFKRTILMSGTAISNFYTTSPMYASLVANAFVSSLGINSSDPDEIHQKLVEMPLEKIIQADKVLLDHYGVTVFFPVVESSLPGIRPVLPEDPETMIAKGYDKDIPLLIGYTSAECESFRKRFEEIDIVARILKNPLLVVPVPALFIFPPEIAVTKAKEVEQRYFNGTPSMDTFIKVCTEMYFEYPALKVAKYRQKVDAPTYLYEYGYHAFYGPLREALGLEFDGAGHVEDLTNVFQVNSVPQMPNPWDNQMKALMTGFFVNFMKYSHPTCPQPGHVVWPPVDSSGIRYEVLESSAIYPYFSTSVQPELTKQQCSIMSFFDGILAS